MSALDVARGPAPAARVLQKLQKLQKLLEQLGHDRAQIELAIPDTTIALAPATFGVNLRNFLRADTPLPARGMLLPLGDEFECILIVQADERWSLSDLHPDFPMLEPMLFQASIDLVLSSAAVGACADQLQNLGEGWRQLLLADVPEGLSYLCELALDDSHSPLAPLLGAQTVLLRGTAQQYLQLGWQPAAPLPLMPTTLSSDGWPAVDVAALGEVLKTVAPREAERLHAAMQSLRDFSLTKLFASFTLVELQLQISTTAHSIAPRARLQLTLELKLADFPGLAALFGTDQPSLKLLLWQPLDRHCFFLSNAVPIPLAPRADDIVNAAPASGISALVESLAVSDLVLGIGWDDAQGNAWGSVQLACLWFRIATQAARPDQDDICIFDRQACISGGSVRIDIEPTLRAMLEVDVQVSKGEHIELRGAVSLEQGQPQLSLSGALRPRETIDITRLIRRLRKNLGLENDGVTAHLPGLTLRDLSVQLVIPDGTFALALDVATDLKIPLGEEALVLKEVELSIEHTGDDTPLFIAGVLSIEVPATPGAEAAALDLRLSLSHMGSGNWLVSGESIAGQLPVGKLINRLGQHFYEGSSPQWECPAALESFAVTEVRASFNKFGDQSELKCHCEGEWSMGTDQKALIALTFETPGRGFSVEGTLHLGEHQFQLDLSKSDATVLAATYSDQNPAPLSLADLFGVVVHDQNVLSTLHDFDIKLKYALLAFESGNKFLAGVEFDAAMSFGKLPLIGAELPDNFGIALNDVKLFIASGEFKVSDLPNLPKDTPPQQRSKNANGEEVLAKGFSGEAQLVFGGTRVPLETKSTPAATEPAGANAQPSINDGSADVPAPPAAAPTWIDVHRASGPFHLERLAVQLADGQLLLGFDAALSIAGLTVALDGLTAQTSLTEFKPQFNLHGLGIDFRNSAVEIGAAFRERGPQCYGGAAVLKFEELSIAALGLYETVSGHTSMCIYAVLDYPIGGPPFFFVTGLAAAFGYSRKLIPPAIENVAQFPLVRFAQRDANASVNLEDDLSELSRTLPPAIGDYFLGVGVRFTSFEIADSFLLLTCSFGSQVEVNLLGISTITAPPKVSTPPVAKLELVLKGAFLPDAGFLGVQAELTPGSYLLSQACHLSGGFAFFSWFGASEHAGDFVLSVGGYHPEFDLSKHPHYPAVPRVALNWKVDDRLNVKGQTYFALTPTGLMFGGALEANWVSDHVHAWFKFAAHLWLEWKPYHYRANVHVELGVDVTFQFFGTHHINVDVGADLSIWGPEFSGTAMIHLSVISVQIAFGPTATDSLHAVGWQEFSSSFVPEQPISIAATNGLVRQTSDQHPDSNHLGTLDPYALEIVIDSAMPAHQGFMSNSDPRAADLSHADPWPIDTKAAALPVESQESFGLRPMQLGCGEFRSNQHIYIAYGDGSAVPANDEFSCQSVSKPMPVALWGDKGTLPAGKVTSNVLTGWRIKPRVQRSSTPANQLRLTEDALVFKDLLTWYHSGGSAPCTDVAEVMNVWASHRPPLPAGTYQIVARQDVSSTANAIKQSFQAFKTFAVGGARHSLSPDEIQGVYPPRGGRGDYTRVAAHIVLKHSTLPWQRSALRHSTADSPPWLALLVLRADEFTGPTTLPLKDLLKDSAFVQTIDVSPDEADATVAVIEVTAGTLRDLAPDSNELSLLTHVRGHSASPDEDSVAIVVSKRLPTQPGIYSAHLVCVEHGYEAPDPKTPRQPTKLIADKQLNARVRLICLHSWTFDCKPAVAASFTARLDHLTRHAAVWWTMLPGGEARVMDLTELRDRRRHDARAWVRGPLTAYGSEEIRRHYLSGLDDSYAAARGLGRLLALRSPAIASGILHWKHRRAHWQATRQDALLPRVQAVKPSAAMEQKQQTPPTLPDDVRLWLQRCCLLEGVPLHYLVPQEQVLPAESMLFFRVDVHWLYQLVTGALGMGGPLEPDINVQILLRDLWSCVPDYSGVLIRSQLVSAWPALLPEGFDDEQQPLKVVRSARLAPNLMLCLFDGVFHTLRVRNPPTMVHFEVAAATDARAAGDYRFIPYPVGANVSSVDVAAAMLSRHLAPAH